eukprot:UN00028
MSKVIISPQYYISRFFRHGVNDIERCTQIYGPLCFLPLVQRLYTVLCQSTIYTSRQCYESNNNKNNKDGDEEEEEEDDVDEHIKRLHNLTYYRVDMLNKIYNKDIAIEISIKIFNINIILQYLLCLDYNNDVIDTTPIDYQWSWCTDDLSIYARLDNHVYDILDKHFNVLLSSSSLSSSSSLPTPTNTQTCFIF